MWYPYFLRSFTQLNSALDKMRYINHNYNSDFENNIRTMFLDFTNKYAQDIIKNGGSTFYVTIQGIVDYSGIALPAGSENHLIRYFAFNSVGAVRIISVNYNSNTVASVFSIAANAI